MVTGIEDEAEDSQTIIVHPFSTYPAIDEHPLDDEYPLEVAELGDWEQLGLLDPIDPIDPIEDPFVPPASTGPPKAQTTEVFSRSGRKRQKTQRYREAQLSGPLPESQRRQ